MLARKLDFHVATWAVPLAVGCMGISSVFVLDGVMGIASPNNTKYMAVTGAKPGQRQQQKAMARSVVDFAKQCK